MLFRSKLDVEDVDQIIGRPFGIPKTGVFGLIDLVGLDLMPHVNASLAATLPKEDMFHEMYRPAPLIERMIKEGYTGRKGKGGFYRVNREKGKRKEAIDLVTGEYRVQKGLWPEELEKEAFALGPGKVGGPVETAMGLHLLKVLERIPARRTPLADVEEEIRRLLVERDVQQRLPEFLQRLRTEAGLRRVAEP